MEYLKYKLKNLHFCVYLYFLFLNPLLFTLLIYGLSKQIHEWSQIVGTV